MSTGVLECAFAVRPRPGETACGDCALVTVDGSTAVVAAIDGLGHGPDAALAGHRALEAMRAAGGANALTLVEHCHAELGETRGAAVSVASFDRSQSALTWLGVGNVEGRLSRAGHASPPEAMMLTPGLVGHDLPALHPWRGPVERGDLLVMATDGIDPAFADTLRPFGPCRAIAYQLLERHARPIDDALVVVSRYLGEER